MKGDAHGSTGTAYDRLLDALREHDCRVTTNGDSAKAQCPHHDDKHPSLCLRAVEEMVLVCCQAGCDTEDVTAALSLTMADLFDNRKGIVHRYPDGRNVFRRPNKKFQQSGNTKGTSLFRADKIADAETVYVVEGEKDVLAVESVGSFAVCSAMGAGKANKFDWSVLEIRLVGAGGPSSGHRGRQGQTRPRPRQG